MRAELLQLRQLFSSLTPCKMPSARSSLTSSYTPNLHNLISSSSYPPIPDLVELESLQASLLATSSIVAADLEKRSKKDKKRKEREEEQAALEANEKARAKLEALDRARVEAQRGQKGSPAAAPAVKVKKERISLSPAPSNDSSASFRPAANHSQPITYASAQSKKKKQKRVVESDDDARCEYSPLFPLRVD